MTVDVTNTWVTVAVSWDLVNGKIFSGIWGLDVPVPLAGTISYTGFQFSPNTKFYICSDAGGTTSLAACTAQNFKVSYLFNSRSMISNFDYNGMMNLIFNLFYSKLDSSCNSG